MSKSKGSGNKQDDMERAIDLIVSALMASGLRVQKQPLEVKMLQAAHAPGDFSYTDPSDLKLLFVNTIRLSAHGQVNNLFNLGRYLMRAKNYRLFCERVINE